MILHLPFSRYFKSPEEKKEWAIWALGSEDVRIVDTAKHWNERHSDLLVLNDDDRIDDTMPKLIQFWMDSWQDKK